MRHSVAGYILGRTKSSRIALRRNLIKQLFIHERIKTTEAKAAAVRGDAERLITIARNSANGSDSDKLNARRLAITKLGDNQLIKRLFDEIAPRFATRPGGYTRVTKLGPRLGDAAEMVVLELVEE
ncbi:MAG: 50S ribosomal protein L17 [Anaerolineales bacterium]|jgi:large subunit ribosomal protein L17|uniref:50S ribosomal protein L17 n=1 Tax=Candidatus Villigracilis affinis TaxID=3140682 RepID=UPI001B6C3D55|nr:50S ribosomal protein L17 [Anaerolineales bacterium]MBK9603428.1 50S ribosomal protein L17 [Anaerolineales bacterium]MBL0346578.1 50S ribosomal protein L17 [Anaerolineales bacterium]MBP8048073.1 50S ribosomal protein L17 [Anaerolineales bacterium]